LTGNTGEVVKCNRNVGENMKNKILKIVLVILLMIACGFGGWFLGAKVFDVEDKALNKKDNVKEKVEKKTEDNSIDTNSELVKSLAKLSEGYNNYGITAVPYSDGDNEVTLKEGISDSVKNTVVGIKVNIDSYIDNNEVTDNDARRITDEGVQLLKSKFEELFGYDGFGETEFGCPHYTMKNGKYYYQINCGSIGLYKNHLVVEKAYYDGEDVIIESKVIFALTSSNSLLKYIITNKPIDVQNYPGDDSINKLYETIVKDDNSEIQKMNDKLPQLMEDTAQKNMDKLNTYIHRFKKHNDKYYLYSVQKAS
jgi:hypothetical protein